MDEQRALLRHFLATLAYRTQKALRDSPSTFGEFRGQPGVRTPTEVVRHMTSVLGYGRTFFIGGTYAQEPLPTLADEVARFHAMLEDLAGLLERDTPLQGTTLERLLQGPLADAMTHAGQIALLRRLAGSPVPPENFIAPVIDPANLGPDQPPPASPDREWPEAPAVNRLRAEIARLAQKYRLTVVESDHQFPIQTRHGEIDGKPAEGKNVESFLSLFLSEWGLYPPELVGKTLLQRVIVCEDLAFAKQPRTAIPDFEHNDLYFDVGRGRSSELYVRKVIHHEFFHVIDFRDDGQLYDDAKWMLLNPPGFKYGPGGKNQQHDSSGSLFSEANPGVLTPYSTAGVEEDKAEVFANMVVNGPAVAERAQRDAVVRAKMQQMKDLLRAFCPQMDETFWDSVGQMGRPQEIA